MIPVRTLPRFKCEFCKKRSTKSVIAKHEGRCYRNPNRYCDECKNTGMVRDEEWNVPIKCQYCARFDKDILKQIEEREKDETKQGF